MSKISQIEIDGVSYELKDGEVQANLAAHIGDKSNPHEVTADQVNAVSYEAEIRTEAEKAQARANIGAAALVVQTEAPEDTSVLWIDPNDDSNTMDVNGVIEAHNTEATAHADMRELIASKGDKTGIVIDATSGNKSLSLSASNSNTEWRYVYASGITSLTLSTIETLANTVEAYYTVMFISGTTATTITNTFNAYFSGDDCVEGVFTPAASKTYDLGIWWNGVKWQVAVRGSI